jgi:hypothetical protein
MFQESPLVEALRELETFVDPRRRGVELEQLVRRLFQAADFQVAFDAAAAAPRQTDLVATYGNDAYLVETKWWKKRAGVGAVDEVRIRLSETHAVMIGVLISVSGFSDGAIKRVERRRDRPILLVDREEFAMALQYPEELPEMLRRKRQELVIHSRAAALDYARSGPSPAMRRSALPVDQVSFLIDGERAPMATFGGDFGNFVFVQNMPDIDWAAGGGTGVHLDMSFTPGDTEGLIDVLHRLVDAGWATGRGRWNIQQASRNWHGAGVASLVDAMRGWRERYDGVEPIHHTEQLCWQDVRAEGSGFYTLTAGIDGHERRHVWHCDVSMQLHGVPLDPEPVRNFASLLGAREPHYFRARSTASVERHHLRDEEALDPLGYVIFDQPDDPEHPEWVCGLIIENPWALERFGSRSKLPEWLPGHVEESELLICALAQYHPVGYAVGAYRFRWCEWAWTSDALVFHPVADWDLVDQERVGRPPRR